MGLLKVVRLAIPEEEEKIFDTYGTVLAPLRTVSPTDEVEKKDRRTTQVSTQVSTQPLDIRSKHSDQVQTTIKKAKHHHTKSS